MITAYYYPFIPPKAPKNEKEHFERFKRINLPENLAAEKKIIQGQLLSEEYAAWLCDTYPEITGDKPEKVKENA